MQALYPSLFPIEAKQFWFDVGFGICFADVLTFMYVYVYVYGFKYHNELCYKALVNRMFVMFQQMVIVNTEVSYVVKLHGKYVMFPVVMLVVGFIEHGERYSPKADGYITTLIKNSFKNI